MTVARGTSIENAFGQLMGRQPSPIERERLYRVRDALGLSDNDAFWYIVMILEHYDSLYRDYPRLIGEHAAATLEGSRQAFAAAAAAESAKAERMLAEKVAETSVAIARRLAERPVGWHRVTTLLAAVVSFGAMCMVAGAHLAGGRAAWGSDGHDRTPGREVLAAVLSARAGWLVFVLLLPGLLYGGRTAWKLATDGQSRRGERVYGWMVLGMCVVGAAGCILLLAAAFG